MNTSIHRLATQGLVALASILVAASSLAEDQAAAQNNPQKPAATPTHGRTTASRVKEGAPAGVARPTPSHQRPSQPSQAPSPPHASPVSKPAASAPALHHAPVSTGFSGKAIAIRAQIVHPEKVREAFLLYRVDDDASMHKVPFLRAVKGPYLAKIPASDVRYPGLAYAIGLTGSDGRTTYVFGSPGTMFHVAVRRSREDMEKEVWNQQIKGRRSVIHTDGEYVDFGDQTGVVVDKQGKKVSVTFPDHYYRAEVGYAYRTPGRISLLGVDVGVLRGKIRKSEEPASSVGLNYIAPRVGLRISPTVESQFEIVTSLTEESFQLGGGAEVIWGPMNGSRLHLGAEVLSGFGSRIFTRMDLPLGSVVTVSPIVELTNMPEARHGGVRLLSEVGVNVAEGWKLAAVGGYQARRFDTGGPTLGFRLASSF